MKVWRRTPQRAAGMPGGDLCADLDACYAYARALTRQHGTTYYFAARFFPPPIRRSIYGLYGFVRVPDEIVDNPEGGRRDCAAQLRALEDWRAQFEAGLDGAPAAHPALRAFLDTMRRHAISPEYPRAFLDSMMMDLEVARYETFEALQKYTYGSASVIGLMICSIVGLRDRTALPYAADLGLAMQLTNFLRDIGEDYRERGRIYLPLEDLDRFGYSERDLAMATIDERFTHLMRFEIARNRAIYRRAELGIAALPEFARYPIRLAGRLYAAILQCIEANGYDVFHRRAATTRAYKLRTAAAMWAAERVGRPLPLIPKDMDSDKAR
jgi:phytoene synthase